MPSTLPLAGTVTLTTTPQTLYDITVDGGNFQGVTYANRDCSNDACIQIADLHGSTAYFPVPPGTSQQFICRTGKISKVVAKSSSGSVIITGGSTANV
jgi:hypothetical protein